MHEMLGEVLQEYLFLSQKSRKCFLIFEFWLEVQEGLNREIN